MNKADKKLQEETKTESEKRRAMSWAARLKRAFNIDISVCEACGGAVKVVAFIEDPIVINKIWRHIKAGQDSEFMSPVNRAPRVNFIA